MRRNGRGEGRGDGRAVACATCVLPAAALLLAPVPTRNPVLGLLLARQLASATAAAGSLLAVTMSCSPCRLSALSLSVTSVPSSSNARVTLAMIAVKSARSAFVDMSGLNLSPSSLSDMRPCS